MTTIKCDFGLNQSNNKLETTEEITLKKGSRILLEGFAFDEGGTLPENCDEEDFKTKFPLECIVTKDVKISADFFYARMAVKPINLKETIEKNAEHWNEVYTRKYKEKYEKDQAGAKEEINQNIHFHQTRLKELTTLQQDLESGQLRPSIAKEAMTRAAKKAGKKKVCK